MKTINVLCIMLLFPILITKSFAQCDTLGYPLQGIITLIPSTYQGYVAGNNDFGDLAKANYFPDNGNLSVVSGAFYWFGAATGNPNQPVEFAVWDNTGQSGTPGNIIASKSIPLGIIIHDVIHNNMTYVQFDIPVIITTPFYVGVFLPVYEGDTIALYTNTDGDGGGNLAWEMWSDGSWYSYIDSWGIDVLQAIFPTDCFGFGTGYSNVISGYVYRDINNNCIYDSTDSPVNNALVKAIPGP
ncbi:MAG: hypothetical protein KJ607_09855, partial [Bacteroidetes bacterium]|nr:hypothetical protein [Bacteroidota bacterium]